MRKFITKNLSIIDVLLSPFVYLAAWLLKKVRRVGVHKLPNCKNNLLKVGVFPIRDHYYEPQFDNRNPKIAFSEDRVLSGIDWNITEQLENLNKFTFAQELLDVAKEKTKKIEFYMNNTEFRSGDAEYWYQVIRSIKPQRIFEIGSGHSTLMAIKAITQNQIQNPEYRCKHVCVEPYEMPWLDELDIMVVRQKVEDLNLSFFSELQKNDILFIDSSHIIRPQGDVLFEYLELLPSLNKGVIVHVHDIFSPKNYPSQWLEHEVKLWNEQYLLEAFLSHNSNWKILGSLNYLHHHYYEHLKSVAPFLSDEGEPGSFYIQKIN